MSLDGPAPHPSVAVEGSHEYRRRRAPLALAAAFCSLIALAELALFFLASWSREEHVVSAGMALLVAIVTYGIGRHQFLVIDDRGLTRRVVRISTVNWAAITEIELRTSRLVVHRRSGHRISIYPDAWIGSDGSSLDQNALTNPWQITGIATP